MKESKIKNKKDEKINEVIELEINNNKKERKKKESNKETSIHGNVYKTV